MKINGFKTLVSMAAALSILLSNGIPFVCTPVNADTVSANGTHNVEIDVPMKARGAITARLQDSITTELTRAT